MFLNQVINFFVCQVFYHHLVKRVLLIESDDSLFSFLIYLLPMNFTQASQWFVSKSTTRKKSRAVNGRASLMHSQTNWMKQKVNSALLQPRTTLLSCITLASCTLILRYSPIRSDTGFICESKGVHSYT